MEATRLPKKRVVTDPNEQFATIEQVYQARFEAGRRDESTAEKDDSGSTESRASCIVIG